MSRNSESDSCGFFDSLFNTPVQDDVTCQNKGLVNIKYAEKRRGRSRSQSHHREYTNDVPPPPTKNDVNLLFSEHVLEGLNLINLDDTSSSDVTFPDPDDIFGDTNSLRWEIQAQAKLRVKREKEREETLRSVVIERDRLMRQLETMKLLNRDELEPNVECPVLQKIANKKV